MKKHAKRVIFILPTLVIMLSAVIAVIMVWRNYADGNRILVNLEELPSAAKKLDGIGIPYGTGRVLYGGEEYAFIESRSELMPIIENCLEEFDEFCGEMILVYRQAHTALFWTVICVGGVGCLYGVIMSMTVKKKLLAYLFITAAFMTAIGCMYLLGILTLTVV